MLQASKPTVLMATTDELGKLPFDVRTFAVLGYDGASANASDLSSALGSAIDKVRLALDPKTRSQTLDTAMDFRTSGFRIHVDFERIRKEAEVRLGKSGCKTVDLQEYDTDTFKGWHQILDCTCGDSVLVVIDLNGDIKRVKVK